MAHEVGPRRADAGVRPGQTCETIAAGAIGPQPVPSLEHESCATTEGFARLRQHRQLVGAQQLGHLAPLDVRSELRGGGPGARHPAPTSAHTELQVAKAFWDFDDFNNEGGNRRRRRASDDRLAYPTDAIVRGWREFPKAPATGRISRADRTA